MTKKETSYYLHTRKNPKTGYKETVVSTKRFVKGWKLVKKIDN